VRLSIFAGCSNVNRQALRTVFQKDLDALQKGSDQDLLHLVVVVEKLRVVDLPSPLLSYFPLLSNTVTNRIYLRIANVTHPDRTL
jgi:hypothetical protein